MKIFYAVVITMVFSQVETGKKKCRYWLGSGILPRKNDNSNTKINSHDKRWFPTTNDPFMYIICTEYIRIF